MIHLLESASGADRLRAATDFLAAVPPGSECVIIGSSRAAIDDLIRRLSSRHGATFGLHRFSLTQVAARLAAPMLSARGLATCTRLAAEAVAARATFAALAGRGIPFFAPVARYPGFGRTLAATLSDLRAAGVGPAKLAEGAPPLPELAVLLAAYEAELDAAHLADRTELLRCATHAIAQRNPDPIVALPLLLLDVAIEGRIERELVGALCNASPHVLITLPAGDRAARTALDVVLPKERLSPPHPAPATTARRPPEEPTTARRSPAAESSLERLQRYLFNETDEPPTGTVDDAVRIFSAPGEGRETVEIARWILAEARAGTRFDDMVVLLRSPESYTALLETAFRRAGVPAYFARGTRRPNPSGRAFLALLACASDGLSARRFAEYLSFGQVPSLNPDGGPPLDRPVWTGPRDEALGAAAHAAEDSSNGQRTTDNGDDTDDTSGALRAPWKWEELIVDAAVIGGSDRWRRRLRGLAHELEAQQAELASEEPDSPRLAGIERERANLAHLSRFALPVIEQLAALPTAAQWGAWLTQLAELAPRVLRQPEPVLQLLAELEPMAAVGPVGLDEVRDVLAERLTSLSEEPPQYRYGRVLVTTLDEARGRTFEIVFVPGLAERIFPQRPREDALLLDSSRQELSADLARQGARIDRERLLLHLAVGAAERRVYLSYPRVDVVQGRPRVTSFYGLDVARATRGEIPDAETFERDAFALVGARLAWPAPPEPAQAIDAAEHDLATLAAFTARGARAPKGAAQYLLELNPHLARALRTRYWRWERPRWTELDGIVRTTADTAPVLAAQRLTARPYSPSALQHFAACPYRFFLASILRLEPRREITPLEQLDPLTRGKLVHRVQAETLRALATAGALPVTDAGLAVAERVLGDTLDTVAARFHEDLAPPILRVWQDEMAALRGDLIYWLRHLADHAATWHPAYFEFGFGVPPDDEHDPRSRRVAVELAGGLRLRGSVDLIEQRADGSTLRVTDHKTGADRTKEGMVIAGGETLQPVLYALAVEAALGTPVQEARLFFCTARGGFAERVVKNDERARGQGRQVLEAIDAAIGRGFLPPAPRAEACIHCDFHLVCGPHEEERARRKESQSLADLAALRLRP
jgi:ATP-dependent helicase/nuclease subunit B